MSTNRKFANGFLLVALAITLAVTGCSGKNNGGNASPSSSAPSSSTPSASSPSDSDGADGGKLFAEPITLKLLRDDQEPPIQTDAPVIKEIFNRTNVKLELQLGTASGDYDQKVQTLIATNNIPDIIYIRYGSAYFNEAAKNGMFLPISDYLDDMPNFKKMLEANPEINKTRVDGKLYGFPVLGDWRLQLSQTPVIRQDLLDELKLEAPKTFDDLYNVLKKFKEAYPDSIPFTNRKASNSGTLGAMKGLSFAMGSGYGIYFDPDVDGGKYVYGQAHAEFKQPLEFVRKLYAEKLLDPDYAVNTTDSWKEKMSSGRSFFFYDNNTFADGFNGVLKSSNPNAQLEVIPLLTNAAGQKRNLMFKKNWLHPIAISAKVKNPQDVIKFLDWMYSPEGTLVTNYGIEDEHYTMEGGKPTFKPEVVKKYAETNDPHAYMERGIGIGLDGSFALNVDEHALAAVSSPDLSRWAEMMTEANGYVYETIDPPFTNDEVERLKTLRSKVDTLVTQELDKFIMGARPMSEYDKFAQELVDAGAAEIEKIYNDANEKYKSAKY